MSNEQQARLDAMADAETLRRIMPKFPPTPDYFGEIAVLRVGRKSAYGHDSAEQWARAAARSAFRAVPALRGE